MIRVLADGKEIDLADNPAIEAQLNSPIVGLTQQGSIIYPFSAPFTAKNDAIFNYFRLPEAAIDRNKTYVGSIYDDNILILEGILSVKETNSIYSIEISGPPAGVSEAFWNKKINTIDIGNHQFNKKEVTTNLYALKITPEIEPYFGISGSRVKIYEGTRNFVTYDFPVFVGNFYNENFDSGVNRTFGQIMQVVAYKFNEDNGLRNEGYELVISSKGINFFAPDTLTNTLNLKISVSYTVGDRGPSTTITKVFDFTKIIYLAPILDGVQNFTLQNNPFVCPTIYNPGFYNEQNKIWSKYVNWYDGQTNKFSENTFRYPTQYSIVPMLGLLYVIKQFLTIMSFKGLGTFFEDNDIKSAIIENTKSIDKQAENCDLTFNIFQTSFEFKEHLPSWTLSEFFNELKIYFGLSIEYDVVNKLCKIDFIQQAIDNQDNEDYSEKVGKIVSLQTSNINKIQFDYDNNYVQESDKNYEINLPIPLASVIETSQDEFTTIKMKISSLPVKIVDASTDSILIRPRGNGSGIVATTTNTTGPVRMYPVCNQLGNSLLYTQDKQEFSLRILLYLGKQKDPQGYDILRSDYKTATLNLSLSETDLTSRYNRFLKSYKSYLENSVEAEANIFLTDAEVANFDWRKKKYIRGIHYFVHQILPTLPVKKPFKIKMKRF